MCVVSNIVTYQQYHRQQQPTVQSLLAGDFVTRGQLSAPRAEVEALKTLLEAANKFDKATNQPDCKAEEKVAFIKKIAEFVGVDLADVLK